MIREPGTWQGLRMFEKPEVCSIVPRLKPGAIIIKPLQGF